MLKPDLLRQMISQHVPWLRENPDNMAVYLRKGRMVSTGQRSASFEYRYTLEVLVMDYPDSVDTISVPILAWARLYQPDLLFNPDRQQNGITFEAEILSNSTMDILFQIQTDESVIVTSEDGEIVTRHRADPASGPEIGAWSLVFKDEVSGETWQDNKPIPSSSS
ncbi:TPA: phage tail protein [Citrobacter freundii]|nr:phage tail protein [Citrobacter freundii]